MNKSVLLLFLLLTGITNAQSIRKNYQEMTSSEKRALLEAFDANKGLVDDIASFHNTNFRIIHFNLPNNPNLDVFLAWHRRQLFEVEQAMQTNNNPNLSIPFWNWTIDNSVSSSLWASDFMGYFTSNLPWSSEIERNLGGNFRLPSSSEVSSAQSISNWVSYSDGLEKGIVHSGPHVWVGGTMATGASPADPVFYLHHGMIDKLWQDWVIANGVTGNLYQATSLPRYPSVDPDDIVNSKSLGVFYAENELAQLEGYEVSNTYQPQENFYYQYTIEAGNDFVVPSSRNAKLESVNEVILKDGFVARRGAQFLAKIDSDIVSDAMIAFSGFRSPSEQGSHTLDNVPILKDVYAYPHTSLELNKDDSWSLYPNPADRHVTIETTASFSSGKLEVVDLSGRVVLKKKMINAIEKFDISQLESGIYLVKLVLDGELYATKKLSRQ